MTAFDLAFDRLLGHEGGYTAGEGDPGGETQWGISKRSYPNEDIKALTIDDAKLIYRRDFWNRIHADELPPALAFQVFDFAVNSGIETAVRYLQRALGVGDDGHFGPITRAAAAKMSESDAVMRFAAERIEFYCRLSTFGTFGKGWVRRVAQNLRYAAEDG